MSEDKEFNTMSPERPDFTIDPNKNYDEPISVGPEGTDGPMSDPGDTIDPSDENFILPFDAVDAPPHLPPEPIARPEPPAPRREVEREGRSEFQEQFAVLKNNRSTDEQRERARENIQDLVRQAEAEGLLLRARQEIRRIALHSDKNEVAANVRKTAKELEEDTDYADHPELRGIVEQAVRNSADAMQFMYLIDLPEAERLRYISEADLNKMDRDLDTQHFWSSGLRWDEVGTESKSRGEEAKERKSLQRGYTGFVDAEFEQLDMKTKEVITGYEFWYEAIDDESKKLVNMRINLARGAFLKGKSLDEELLGKEGADLDIQAEALDNAFDPNKFPGFRMAFATMMKEMFITDHNGTLVLRPEFADANRSRFTSYRQGMVDDMAIFLSDPANRASLDQSAFPADAKLASRAAVSAAWNFIDLGMGVESGDRRRQMGDIQWNTESARQAFMPHMKAENRWIKNFDDGEEIEGWGGKWGAWLANEIKYDPNFRQRFQNGDLRGLVPDRMIYSFFDHTRFKQGNYRNQSFSQVFTNPDNIVQLNDRFVDYDLGDDFTFYDTGATDLWFGYKDSLQSVIKIEKILFANGKDASDLLKADPADIDAIGDAFVKLRRDPLVGPQYYSEDLVVGIIAMHAGGPKVNSAAILLDIGIEYDQRVTNLMNRAQKILTGMPRGTRGRIFSRLNANDGSALQSAVTSYGTRAKRAGLEVQRGIATSQRK